MHTVRAGSYQIGVRSNTEPAHDAMREILRNLLIEGKAPPNYSMQLSPESAPGTARFHRLLKGCTLVRRARHASDVLDELLARIDELASEDDTSVVRLQVAAFVREGHAVLVPAWMEPRLDRRGQQLRRSGFARVAGSVANVDVETAQLAVRPPSIVLDSDALDRWRLRLSIGNPPPRLVPVGRYPIAAWAFVARPGEQVIRSPAATLPRALAVVANRVVAGTGTAVQTVAKVLDRARVGFLPPADVDLGRFMDQLLQ